jgi:hypothetical protein
VTFYKGGELLPLTLYRGEVDHPSVSKPHSFPRALYFGDLETAHAYSDYLENSGDYKTSRIYPVHIVLKRPFINQPEDPFLDMPEIVSRLGLEEARRIAKRFAKYIEETDQWRYRVNSEGRYDGVEHYLACPRSDVNNLCFQAYRFFDSQMEVNRLRRLGYDGAIHAGSGSGSAGKPEYCVFNIEQVFSIPGQSFLSK